MWDSGAALLWSVGVVLYAYWFYQIAIGVHGFRNPQASPSTRLNRRFVVIVPAHNEELVVGHLLKSLNEQSYPRHEFDIVVSCDSCTDRTAAIAAAAGARVLSRDELLGGGKTGNLRWAMGQLALDDYDSVLVFDADNLVRRDFLERMNDYLDAHPGAAAVQGYLEAKNPDDSWVTRVYAIAFWYSNRFWQLARSNLGLSVNLGGTGELIRISTLRTWGWDWSSLTDDLELTCRIVLSGGRVHWNAWAIAFDEKPVTHRASSAQRARWLRGHYWALKHYGGPLLLALARHRRLQFLDLLLHLLIPGRAAMSYATMFGGFVLATLGFALDPWWPPRTALDPIWLLMPLFALMQCTLVLVVAPSIRFGRPTFRYVRDLPAYVWYGLRWLPTLLSSISDSRAQAAWSKTAHTRAIALEDVERRSNL